MASLLMFQLGLLIFFGANYFHFVSDPISEYHITYMFACLLFNGTSAQVMQFALYKSN